MLVILSALLAVKQEMHPPALPVQVVITSTITKRSVLNAHREPPKTLSLTNAKMPAQVVITLILQTGNARNATVGVLSALGQVNTIALNVMRGWII